jgi:hypothetical protein
MPTRERIRTAAAVGEEGTLEPQEYDALIRQLAAIQADLRLCAQEQRNFNARQLVLNTTIEATLARLEFIQGRLETLLDRLTRLGDKRLF